MSTVMPHPVFNLIHVTPNTTKVEQNDVFSKKLLKSILCMIYKFTYPFLKRHCTWDLQYEGRQSS